MNSTFRPRLILVLMTAFALCSATRAEDVQPCKNHYILAEPCPLSPPMIEWETLPNSTLSHDYTHAAVLLADGRVLVIGGANRGYDPVTRSYPTIEPFGAETYDPSTRQWRATGPMTRYLGYRFQAVRLLDGRVLALDPGGDIGNDPGVADVFDPASDTWTATGTFNIRRSGFTTTLLPDGKVLVVGGIDPGDAVLGSAETWDPGTGAWRITGGLGERRAGHSATALPDGRVLVVGGIIDDYFLIWSTGSAEVFDPATETWSKAGSIEARAAWHSATLTEDGEVVVAGGYVDQPIGQPLFHGPRNFRPATVASASIYNPAAGSWRNVRNLNVARYGHLAVPLQGFGVLLFGGKQYATPIPPAPQERTEFFARGADSWSYIDAVNALPESAGMYHSATALADGTVLFIGEGRRAALLKYSPRSVFSVGPRSNRSGPLIRSRGR